MRREGSLVERAQGAALGLWRWFFPLRIDLSPAEAELLRSLFPTLPLARVRFHLGLPHAVRLLGSQAITLPALFAPRRVRIYFDPACWSPGSADSLGTLAHEAFHALQIQETAWGAGPFRPFLWLYFACGAANRFRYAGHPLEDDAYHHAGRPSSRFDRGLLERGGGDAARAGDQARLGALGSRLAIPSADVEFRRRIARSTPGVGRLFERRKGLGAASWLALPLVAPWLALWVVATAAIWLLLLFLELVGLFAAGSLRLLAGALEMFSNDAFSLSRWTPKD